MQDWSSAVDFPFHFSVNFISPRYPKIPTTVIIKFCVSLLTTDSIILWFRCHETCWILISTRALVPSGDSQTDIYMTMLLPNPACLSLTRILPVPAPACGELQRRQKFTQYLLWTIRSKWIERNCSWNYSFTI